MIIFGIETSCDETSLALLDANEKCFDLKKHVISSQAEIHAKYGGVVPEVAARRHLEVIQPLIDGEIGRDGVAAADIIAVTYGPGLVTSLMVGVQTAKTLSYAFKKPLIGINHLEAHIYANWLSHPNLVTDAASAFPSLILIVSGGHTLFVLMRGIGQYELLGQTRDDAAGESFDKVAKLLNLGYPGGPAIAERAGSGNSSAIDFPRPLLESGDYDVSFSGLKTAVRYYLEKQETIAPEDIPDIAASFQEAVVDLLVSKVRQGARAYTPRSLMLVGGVSANQSLRERIAELGKELGIPCYVPDRVFTGDNAAMIAAAGFFRSREASLDAWKMLSFDAQARFI